MYHKYLGFREFANMENEANLLLLLGIPKLKGFQLQGASPLDPAGGSAPRPPL